MESDIDRPPTTTAEAAQQLGELERHRLQVYTAQVLPGWAWPALAVAVGLFFAAYAIPGIWPKIAGAAVYCLAVGVWCGVVTRRSGVQPRLRGMPTPLTGLLWRFWVGGAIGVVVVGLTVSFLLAGALAATVTYVGGTTYERQYWRRAAELVPAQAA